MSCFASMEGLLIKVEDNEFPSTFQCIICKDNFASRSEQNEHLEKHFIHRKCEHCDKSVIIIGDLEFELHRPSHCTYSTVDICTAKLEPVVKLDFPSNSIVGLPNRKNVATTSIYVSEFFENELQDNINYIDTLGDEYENEYVAETEMKFASKTKNASEENSLLCKSRRKISKVNYYSQDIDRNSEIQTNVKNKADDNFTDSSENSNNETPEINIKKKRRKITPDLQKITCEVCNKKFCASNTFSRHLREKHNIAPNSKCDICGFVCKQAKFLRHHMLIHSDKKLYMCSYCGKGFNSTGHLKEHTNSHTGEKPFECKLCKKTFSRSSLQRSHMRQHSGEKPYKCNVENCTREYAYTTDLTRHKRGAHGIMSKPHECTICSKIYYEKKFLRKHMQSHMLIPFKTDNH